MRLVVPVFLQVFCLPKLFENMKRKEEMESVEVVPMFESLEKNYLTETLALESSQSLNIF